MGVPSGGPKTIAVDLTGKFSGRSRAIRIATSACVYWDRIYLSENTAAPPVRIGNLHAASAELAFRGYSALNVLGINSRSPSTMRHGGLSRCGIRSPACTLDTARRGSCWTRSMTGLSSWLRAMNCASISIRGSCRHFYQGGSRDFLLYVDGWSKDADANTAASTSVEPLPFHGMTRYPYSGSERFPDDPAHRSWRELHNTRPVVRTMPMLAPAASRKFETPQPQHQPGLR